MLGLVLLSGACASAAAESVDVTRSIEKNRLGSSRRVHGLNEEVGAPADEHPSSFTQQMKREGVHQEDVPRQMNAPAASHDVGVLSSKGEKEEEEEGTLLFMEHHRRRRRAKINSPPHLPHGDVGVSTNDGGYGKVEEDVQYPEMEEAIRSTCCCWMSSIYRLHGNIPFSDD